MGKKSRRVRGRGQQTNQRRPLTPTQREMDIFASRLSEDPLNEHHPLFNAYIQAEMERMMNLYASLPSDDPWNEHRINALYCYGMMLMQVKGKKSAHTVKDSKFVKKVRKSETEPVFLRAFAYRLAGLLSCFG
jgi:hypothetical protein